MVFGERLNTFDESKKDLMEFQNAAVKFLQSLPGLHLTGSWIKYYHTKPVRDFLEGLDFICKLWYVHGYQNVVGMSRIVEYVARKTGVQMRQNSRGCI